MFVYCYKVVRKHCSNDPDYGLTPWSFASGQPETTINRSFLYFIRQIQFKNQECSILAQRFQGRFIKNVYDTPNPKFWYGANFQWVYLSFGFPPRSTFKLDWRRLCPWQTFQSLSWCNSSSLASKFMWEWPTIYYYILCQPSKTSDTQSQIRCQHCRVLVEISNTITGGLRWSMLEQQEVLLKSVICFSLLNWACSGYDL